MAAVNIEPGGRILITSEVIITVSICVTILAVTIILAANFKKFRNVKIDAKILGNPIKFESGSENTGKSETVAPPAETASVAAAEAATIAGQDGHFMKVWDALDEAFSENNIWKLKEVFSAEKDKIELDNRDILFSKYNYMRARLGDADGLVELTRLAEDNPAWRFPYRFRVMLFDKLGEKDSVFAYIKERYEKAPAPNSALTESYFELLTELSTFEEICASAATLKTGQLTAADVADVFWKVAEGFKKKGRLDLFVAFGERALSIDPTNNDLRFRFAYQLGEMDGPKWLVRYHYDVLGQMNPNGSFAKNNLAASFNTDDEGEVYGLAMAQAIKSTPNQSAGNLAIHAAKAGLFDYARSVLETHGDPAGDSYSRVKEAERFIEKTEKKASGELEKQKDSARKRYQSLKAYIRWPAVSNECEADTFGGQYLSKSGDSLEVTKVGGSKWRAKLRSVVGGASEIQPYSNCQGELSLEGGVLTGYISEPAPKTLLTSLGVGAAVGHKSGGEVVLVLEPGGAAERSVTFQRVVEIEAVPT